MFNNLLEKFYQHPLQQVFVNRNDNRVYFFEEKLSLTQIKQLLKLRELVYEGTGFAKSRMTRGSYKLHRPEVRGNYGILIRPASDEHNTRLLLNILILHKPEQRQKGVYLNLLRQYDDPLFGAQYVLYFSMIALVIFLTLSMQAKQVDAAHNRLFEENIKNGACTWVKNGCRGHENVYDCYLPETADCRSGDNTHYLTMVTFFLFAVGIFKLLDVRSNRVIEIMHKEFNNAKYDILLDNICLQDRDENVNWDCEIQINQHACSLRTLILTLLISFDDTAYAQIFSEILPSVLAHKAFRLKMTDEYVLTGTCHDSSLLFRSSLRSS